MSFLAIAPTEFRDHPNGTNFTQSKTTSIDNCFVLTCTSRKPFSRFTRKNSKGSIEYCVLCGKHVDVFQPK